MKKMIQNIKKFLEIKFGWIFINGHKEKEWWEHLEEKYNNKNNDNGNEQKTKRRIIRTRIFQC